MKITHSSEKIGAFGGLHFVSQQFMNLGLEALIREHLGSRVPQATYSYSDVIQNLWLIFFAGGDCSEDIEDHLREDLEQLPGLQVCSADTIGRVQKSLALGKEVFTSKSDTAHEFSRHSALNSLNMGMLVKTGALKAGKSYDLDYDNQFVPCEKYDSKKSYKMKNGYFPGVATIGRNIVYFENQPDGRQAGRNGNSNVKYKQAETLQATFDLLKSRDISIGRSRMDCGSFTKDVIDVVQANSNTFYIRAQRCAELSEQIRQVEDWQTVRVGFFDVEVCSIMYAPFGQKKQYRYVVSREKNNSGQTDLFFQDNFIYRAIITDDDKSTEKQIIEYYNQRGSAEKIFDEMNNDFGWKNLPFSFLQENTVYMILMAMCRNFYLYMIEKIAQNVPFIQPTFRLKKFIFRFIVVPFKWIRHARQDVLKLYTTKPYPLQI